MQVDGRRILFIPSDLAYGSTGIGSIPPNSTLIFDVELLTVEITGTQPVNTRNQIIYFAQDVNNLRLTSTGELKLNVLYTSDDPTLAGFSLAVFFNDGLELTSVDNLLTTNIQAPVVAGDGSFTINTPADTNNLDNDAATTKLFRTSWVDFQSLAWPGQVPVELYSLTFQSEEDGNGGFVTPIIRFYALETASGNPADFDGPGKPGEAAITVVGVNTKPVFDPLSYVASLVQRSTGDVVTVVATDADATDTLTYSISAGNLDIDDDGNLAFAINAANGVITVNDAGDLLFNQVPDNKFTLTVSANDGFESVTATVTVEITNAAPVFGTFDPVTIDEDSDVGTPIGTFTADAVDNDALTYSIFSGNADLDGDGNFAFAINAETGLVTVNDSGDLVFATQPTFNLVVRASDPFGATANTTVVVNLNEVTPINQAPVLTAVAPISLVEGATGNVVTVVATDADGDPLTYIIVGGNTDVDGDGNLPFAINPETGVITVNDSGDLVFPNSFDLQVQADDQKGGVSSTDITINLTEVAVNNPIEFQQTFGPFKINEKSPNGVAIGKVTAIDADPGDRITYSCRK